MSFYFQCSVICPPKVLCNLTSHVNEIASQILRQAHSKGTKKPALLVKRVGDLLMPRWRKCEPDGDPTGRGVPTPSTVPCPSPPASRSAGRTDTERSSVSAPRSGAERAFVAGAACHVPVPRRRQA